MASGGAQPIIYAGVDEAGYGPRLGPLAVGLSVFRIEGDVAARGEGDAPPDLWRALHGAVSRAGRSSRRAPSAIYVDDSKRLKGGNGLKTRHPLDRLEQGVLSFLHLLGEAPDSDLALVQTLGASVELAPWYLGDPIPAPLTTSPGHIGVMANALARTMCRRGVELLALRCALVGETAFNEIVAAHGSKAVVNFSAAALHLRRIWRLWGHESPTVVVDRQGGRICYGRQLGAALPDAEVRAVDETNDRSVYDLRSRAASTGGGARRMRIVFQVQADGSHLPAALASMTAKLVRELAMARLNRYWSQRIPDLRPTAGYGADARRWLSEVEPHVTASTRASLVRRA